MKFKRNEKSGAVAFELDRAETQLPVQAAESAAALLPIFHLRKILVPVDFSDRSQKAVAYAVALAKQFEAGLTLVYVLRPLYGAPELAPLEFGGQVLDLAREKLNAICLDVRETCPCEALILGGIPHKEITSLAMEQGSDLIIVSTRGRTGVAHAILGSVAERIVRTAPCPVLVVREKEHEFLDSGGVHEN